MWAAEIESAGTSTRARIGVDIPAADRCHAGVTDAPNSMTPAPSVAICVDRDALDRYGRSLRLLVIGLVEQASAITIVSSDPRAEGIAVGSAQFIAHPRIGPLFTRRKLARLAETLSANSPGIVQSTGAGTLWLAQSLATELDADLVVLAGTSEDVDALSRVDRRNIRRYVALTEPLRGLLESRFGIAAGDVELIRLGLLAAKAPACFRDRNCDPTLVCLSPLTHHSGVSTLIETLHLLRQRGIPLATFLLASGDAERSLRRQVRAFALDDLVAFAQPGGDAAAVLRDADILIHLSHDTGSSPEVLAGMAAGMCVVSTGCPLSDNLLDGETAVLSPPGAAEALAANLARLIHDRDEAQRIAMGGLNHTRAHHTASGMAERFAALYRALTHTQTTYPITG